MEQRRFFSGTAAIALVFLTVSLAVSPGTAQCFSVSACTGTQVSAPGSIIEGCCVGTSGAAQCFSTLTCDGAQVSAPGNTIEDCCLGTDEGLTYLTSSGSEGCRACIVFGWIDGSEFVGDETNAPYRLEIGFIKGFDLFDDSLVLPFSVTVTPGSAVQGANADFTVTNLNPFYRRAIAPPNPAVSTILRVDDLAQEFDETFQLTLVPSQVNPALDFRGSNQFLLDTLTVTIIDRENVTFSFTESDYSDPEQGEVVEVTVRRSKAIANPVTVRIVPLNFTEYEDSGIMANLPEVEPEKEFTPNRAKNGIDFDAAPIEIPFENDTRSMLEITVPITIIDDEINEVEEIFVAILELVDAVNPSQVEIFSGATLCRITDNDDILIGFERPEYRLNETDERFTQFSSPLSPLSPILIIKENGVVTEQVFRVSITAGVPDLSGIGNAQFRPSDADDDVGDYNLGQGTPSQTLIEFFSPEAQSFRFPFRIFDDDLPEGTEAFGLTISTSPEEGGQFTVGTFGSTVVIIEDNDNVIVGFENTSVTVNETDLRAELCVRVFVPDDTESLAFNFFFDTATVAGTADETDYVAFNVFNNPLIVAQFGQDLRRFCFDVTINDDSLFELTETFNVTIGLGFGTPQSGIIVEPAEAVITIIDDGALAIALDPTTYDVDEGGVETLRIVKIGESQYPVSVELSTMDGSATAGSDYIAITTRVVTFGPSDIEQFVNVTTLPDAIVEGMEQFTAEISNTSLERVTLQDRTATVNIIDPPVVSDTVTCTISSPRMISPFSETNTYSFSGSCEHVLVSTCDESLLDFEIRVDFLSADLSNGRIGARNGDSFFIYTEDGTVEVTNANATGTVGNTTEYEGGVFVTQQTDITTIEFTEEKSITININITDSSYEVTQSVTPWGPTCGLCGNISGELIHSDGMTIAQIMDREQVEEFAASYIVEPVDQFLNEEVRRACGIFGNDTVIGDPLMAVPFQDDQTSLCYEIHGVANKAFNLISDTCTSVNAYYKPMNVPDNGNIISEIGVRAVSSSGDCINIRVYQEGSRCQYEINGALRNETLVVIDDVRVRKIRDDKVRIYVPNCEDFNLVMGVTCQVVGGQEMMRFDISRGLNLRPTSHGLLGQFWNIDLDYVIYTGTLPPDLEPWRSFFRVVTVTPGDGSPQRSFLAEQFHQRWDRSSVDCFYAGNSQGGELGEMVDPNDSVIEGTYRDYCVAGLFEHEFTFSQFENDRCNN